MLAMVKPNPSSELIFEIDRSIGMVTFNRPKARNALTFSMYRQLADLCTAPPQGVKVLIITGAGKKAFAAGTDIALFRDFKTQRQAIEYEKTMDEVLDKIERCPIPTIAAISGACTGGGAVIASVCDLRICSHDLQFGLPIARTLGNCLSAANLARLSALLGAGRTREMIFTSRLLDATEAYRIGLVCEVLDNHQAMQNRVLEVAETLTRQAPLTLRATKEIQRRLAQNRPQDRDWIVRCYTSDDFQEGLEAFLNKRQPQWEGK